MYIAELCYSRSYWAIVLLNYLAQVAAYKRRFYGMEPKTFHWPNGMRRVVALWRDRWQSGIISRGVADLILAGWSFILFIQKKKFQFAKIPGLLRCCLSWLSPIFRDLAHLINPHFYGEWKDSFDMAYFFGFVWLFAAWFITKRQRKTIERERMIALEREKEYKVTESIKAELELQVQEKDGSTYQTERWAAANRQPNWKPRRLSSIQSEEKWPAWVSLPQVIAHEIQKTHWTSSIIFPKSARIGRRNEWRNSQGKLSKKVKGDCGWF